MSQVFSTRTSGRAFSRAKQKSMMYPECKYYIVCDTQPKRFFVDTDAPTMPSEICIGYYLNGVFNKSKI